MKTIIFLTAVLFILTNLLQAQNKIITIYYSGDSTEVVNIANTDSIIVFICGASRVKYDDKFYNTVPIGEQCWLKENLDAGTMIDGSANQINNNPNYIEKYCYNNNPANCTTYGGLYQWDEAMQYVTTEGAKGICPEGWHIPTYAEFVSLAEAVNWDGNALKAQGQPGGTNTSGFSALLAGYRFLGNFYYIGNQGNFWSSSERSAGSVYAKTMLLGIDASIALINVDNPKHAGSSVRCIKN